MPSAVDGGRMGARGVRYHLFRWAEESGDVADIPETVRDGWLARFKKWGVFHQRDGQENHFMLRLTTGDGRLTATQLSRLADLASEYATGPASNPVFGDAWLDCTTRGSLQLHWIHGSDLATVLTELEEIGITTRSSGGPGIRNLVTCPLAGRLDDRLLDPRPTIEALQTRLRQSDAFDDLPGKFNVAVGGCPCGCVRGATNDLQLVPAARDDEVGFDVRVGGGLGDRQAMAATPLDLFVPREDVVAVVRGVLELYDDHGDRERHARRRFKHLVDEWGTEKLRARLVETYLAPGLGIRRGGNPATTGDGTDDHVGVTTQRDGRNAVGLCVPVGRIRAEDASRLADLAAEYGSGELRLTRRQNVLLPDVPESALESLHEAAVLDEYSPSPSSFLRGGVGCTGTEFCSIALVETKARTRRLLRWLDDAVTLPADVDDLRIHVSGCTADCGQSQTADIGLMGTRARTDDGMREAFDIGVGGRLGDDPRFVEWVERAVPVDTLPGALVSLIEAYADNRADGESFADWCAATGVDTVGEYIAPATTDFEDLTPANSADRWYPFVKAAD